MSKSNRTLPFSVAALVVLALLLSACATQPAPVSAPAKTDSAKTEPAASSKPAPAPTQAPTTSPAKAEPAAAPTKAVAAPEKPAPAAAASKPAGTQAGGTLVWALQSLPTGLDPQLGGAIGNLTVHYLGSALVARDLKSGAIVPFLAESWKVSEDGLTLEFKLKKNIKWHDGTPLTAKDYVYSIQRVKDPATKSPIAAPVWGAVSSANAVDDYTLVLKFSQPDASFLINQAISPVHAQPVPKHAIDKLGSAFDTQPVLSGPFRFKEFQRGVRLVLERNPDFNWGPPWHPGPAAIQTIEFREVKEYATILAALETGEIDVAEVQPKDIDRLKATGKIHLEELLQPGLDPTMAINVSKAPWDDSRVRKAVNLALDRQAMIKVVMGGHAEEQKGPLSKTTAGYWSGVEKLGYGLDLNQAKALMKEAGYTTGSGGILTKDGRPLKVNLTVMAQEPYSRVGQMVKEQLKALGIDLTIQEMPRGDLNAYVGAGKHDLAILMANVWPDALVNMTNTFHSSNIGGTNRNIVRDPKMDELVAGARASTDEGKRLELLARAQQLAIEQAYSVPLYTPKKYLAISNRVKGLNMNENTFVFATLLTAYIDGGR